MFCFPSSGAMLVICDVNEYRKCVKEFGVPIVSQLFEKLHALCNLLAVVPENLKEVCGGEQLVSWMLCNVLLNRHSSYGSANLTWVLMYYQIYYTPSKTEF